MTSKQKRLNLLGLAFRAGKIISGEDLVIKSMQQQKAKLVFVASDASSSTIDKFDKKCYFYNVECIYDFDTDELSKSIGKPMRKIIALTDKGFCDAFKKIKEVNENEG